MKQGILVLIVLVAFIAAIATAAVAPIPISGDINELLKQIVLPEGFSISLYASNMTSVRSLAKSTRTRGLTYAGTFNFQGIDTSANFPTNVYAMLDSNNDGVADKVYVVANNLTGPNGVAYHEGDLYIAENDRILVLRDIDNHLANPPQPELLVTFIDTTLIKPDKYWHGWRYIRFSPAPENLLYLAIGSPCNTPSDPAAGTCSCLLRFDEAACLANPSCVACSANAAPGPMQNIGQIVTMNPNGTNLQMFAEGMRNSLGLDWHPDTGKLWWTENGRDNWHPDHDNRPPDELNTSPVRGQHFGFPFCYGYNMSDNEFNTRGNCSGFVGAAQELAPHVAALGMRFYKGHMFPERFRGGVFIAEHGSWNRNPPIGYRVTFVPFDNNLKPAGYQPFATGWLNATGPIRPDGLGTTWGRLADIEVLDDGSMLVSNELRGEVYRISFDASAPAWVGISVGAIALLVVVGSVVVATYFDRKRKYTGLA